MSDGCPFIACWVSVSNFRDAVKRTGAIFTERERRIVTVPNRAETETRVVRRRLFTVYHHSNACWILNCA